MKINPLFIIISILVIVLQKIVFADPMMVLSNEYPLYIFIFPVIILALPLEIDRPVTLIIAFFLGLTCDVLNDTLGISSFALVMMAYFRQGIINLIQPRKGYQVGIPLGKYGITWVISYILLNLLIFCFAFFIVDAFTFVYFKKIVVNSLLAAILSTPFCVLVLSILKFR